MMQEVMRETAGWSELGFSLGLAAIIQFGWDTTGISHDPSIDANPAE